MGEDPKRRDVSGAVVPVAGRTAWDLIAESQLTPRIETLLLDVLDGLDVVMGVSKRGLSRVAEVIRRVGERLGSGDGEPQELKAIPERVTAEVFLHVAREERGELHELWASLLVGAARGADVDAFYIDIIRKLDGNTVAALRAIAKGVLQVDGGDIESLLLQVNSEERWDGTRRRYYSPEREREAEEAKRRESDRASARAVYIRSELREALGEEESIQPALERALVLGLIEQDSVKGDVLWRLTGAGARLLHMVRPD